MNTSNGVNDGWLEKRVCVKDKLIGTLKYFGATKFSDGLWCGIELDEPVGKNNGTVKNVKYFTCLPNYGIFVPVSKVKKIENIPKNLNGPLMHFNGRVKEMQNRNDKTIVISNSDSLSYNSNKENKDMSEIKKGEVVENERVKGMQNLNEKTIIISNSDSFSLNSNKENYEIKKSEVVKNKKDSEDSLGILDLSLIESLTNSWDSFNLDVASENAPNFKDSSFKLGYQETDFVDTLPVSSSLFSNEICNPKYASTPRHPVKSRFTEICSVNNRGLTSQNIGEHNDVFENQLTHGVFFDNEKLKNNPNLTSTCEYNQANNTSRGEIVNIFSPNQSHSISSHIDLNKTQIISPPFITNQEIIPLSMDLNKTQTFSNDSKRLDSDNNVLSRTFKKPTEIDCQETNDSGSIACFQINQDLENCQNVTPVDTIFETDCTESKDLNITLGLKSEERLENCQTSKVRFPANTLSKTGFIESKDLNSTKEEFESTENCQKSYLVGTLADNMPCTSVNLLSTHDFGVKFEVPAKESPIKANSKSRSDLNQSESANIYLSETFNHSLNIVMNGGDVNKSPFELTFVLDSSEQKLNNEKEASIKALNHEECTQLESFDYKSKILEETVIIENSLSDINSRQSICIPTKSCKTINYSKRFSNIFDLNSTFNKQTKASNNASLSLKNPKNVLGLQYRANDAKKKDVEFKKPFSQVSSFRKSKTIKAVVPNTFENKCSYLKECVSVHSDKHLIAEVPLKSSVSSNIRLAQESKKNNFNTIENKSTLQGTSSVPKKNSKSDVNSVYTKSKKGRLSASFNLDNKLDRQAKATVKSRCSRRFSYSQSAENTGLLYTQGNLPLLCKHNESLNKIKFISSPEALSANNSNASYAAKVPLNGTRKSIFNKNTIGKTSEAPAKNVLGSQLKEPTTTSKFSSSPSLVLSSNVCGIPRRNSLASNSKKALPVGIIKPRYSMKPLVEETKFESKNSIQVAKSNDGLLPESVSMIRNSAELPSSKTSKIASSLPQKRQIATRTMAQKYSDTGKENDASPKIARYNLRGKK